MSSPYHKERSHETYILNSYKKNGYHGTRSAGSKGIADLIVWNEHEIIFIASQRVKWDIRKQELIWRTILRPPNSFLKFYAGSEIEDGDELAAKYGWVINPVSQELLEFGKKNKWYWVRCIR